MLKGNYTEFDPDWYTHTHTHRGWKGDHQLVVALSGDDCKGRCSVSKTDIGPKSNII